MKRFRLPSPSMVVALLALFVALGGTAVAAGIVPLAKRALVADNAKKLGGLSLGQIGASLPALITVRTAPWSLAAGAHASAGLWTISPEEIASRLRELVERITGIE